MQPRLGMKSQVQLLRACALAAILVAVPVPVLAQFSSGTPGFAKEGGYAGLSLMPGFTFDGVTFDGESIYKQIDGDEIEILPKLSTQNLVRFLLGYRGKSYGVELSYDRTSHDGVFVGLEGNATFQAFNIDGRYFFLPARRVQPYVSVGGSFPWFTVKEGSFLEGSESIGDANFKGYGVNAEGGVVFYPHRQLGVSAGYQYRVLSFDQVTGVSDKLLELRPRFRETSGTVVVSGHVIF